MGVGGDTAVSGGGSVGKTAGAMVGWSGSVVGGIAAGAICVGGTAVGRALGNWQADREKMKIPVIAANARA